MPTPVRPQTDEEILSVLRRAERSQAAVTVDLRLPRGFLGATGVPRGVSASGTFELVLGDERTRVIPLGRVEGARLVPPRLGRELRPIRPAREREAEHEEDGLPDDP